MNDKVYDNIRRSLILSSYIKEWGYPKTAHICTWNNCDIEIYFFPPKDPNHVCRIATIGASKLINNNNEKLLFEYLVVLPPDFSGITEKRIESLIMNLIIHSTKLNWLLKVNEVIEVKNIFPDCWRMSYIWRNEPWAEDESVQSWDFYGQKIDLIWVVPIYETEKKYISEKGRDAFEDECDMAGCNLFDPSREPVV